jgi:hypothetical protein
MRACPHPVGVGSLVDVQSETVVRRSCLCCWGSDPETALLSRAMSEKVFARREDSDVNSTMEEAALSFGSLRCRGSDCAVSWRRLNPAGAVAQ